MLVVPTWDDYRLARASRYVYRGQSEEVVPPPPTDAGLVVVKTWDGYRLARASRYVYRGQSKDVVAPPEPETLAPHAVRLPFRPFGRNPYLRHGAHDLSFVEPLDLPSVVRAVPFKPFGRTPYRWHHRAADESVAVAPEPEPLARLRVHLPFRALGRNPYLHHRDYASAPVVPPEAEGLDQFLVYRPFAQYARRPQLGWHGSVEGVEQQDDAGGGLQIVPDWDGFRLARAGRFSYWAPSVEGAAAPAEPETAAPYAARRAFRPLGRNPYLYHRDYDSAPAAPVEPTHVPHRVALPFRALARNPYLHHRDAPVPLEQGAQSRVVLPFRSFGRNPYLFHRDYDSAPAAPVDIVSPPYRVALQFRAFTRNPYLQHRDYDSAPAAPVVADGLAPFRIHRPFAQYARRPQLGWSAGVEGPAQLNDTGTRLLVVRSFEGYRLARAGRYAYWGHGADLAAPVVVPLDLPHLIRRVPFRPFGRNPYLRHTANDFSVTPQPELFEPFLVRLPLKRLGRNPYLRHRAQDENAPVSAFQPAWAKNANAILGAGKVA